jgi:hypothetical protein
MKALGRLRREVYDFEVSLGYVVRPISKKQNNDNKTKLMRNLLDLQITTRIGVN